MEQDRRLPLVLLADSQLLFWQDTAGTRFLERVRGLVAAGAPRAAYLGASNGDVPEFFDLFRATLADVDVTRCRHIPAEPSAEDRAFLAEADWVMLAGGDPVRGIEAFRRHGLDTLLIERYLAGALLMGISAGAVQFGLAWRPLDDDCSDSTAMLRLAPWVVDAHDAPEWITLREVVQAGGPGCRGLGVPAGGGVLLHPDQTLEPVRLPVTLLEWQEEALVDVLLAPGGALEAGAPPGAAAEPA